MPSITVATFNIRRCEGLDGRVDVARTGAVLRSTGAEVVALQEVDRGVARSGRTDQPSLLGGVTGLAFAFCPALSIGEGEYGIALGGASLPQARCVRLPRAREEEPRVALVSRLRGISFVVTHLALEADARSLQLAELARLVAGVEGPVVLMGDLNSTRRGLAPVAAAGLRPPRRRLRTHSAAFPHKQIDWVLAGRGARVRTSWTLRSRASDHLPLVAVIEYG